MKLKVALLFLLLAIVTACGGGAGGPAATSKPPVATQKSAGGAGSVDCAAISAAAQQLLAIQLLAQLSTPETVEAIRDKQIGNLDLDAFLAAMDDLHALDSFSGPLGDPRTAIDTYQKAARAAKVLFAADPVTQAAIDAYKQNVGPITDFIGHEAAISVAIGAAGC
jgi:hypothetical protein